MKRSKFSIYGATLVLAVVVAIPLTTALLKETSGHYSATLQEQASENKPELRAARRALTRLNASCGRVGKKQDAACQAYTIVQKECFARQSPYYQNTGCPTINDMTRITQVQKALERGEPAPALPGSSSSAAEQATAGGVTLKDLQPSERMAVRRAIQVKNCSKKLPQAMYLICSAVVGEDQQAAPMGLTNDLAKIREERATKRATTLKERIEMTEPVQR